MVARSPYRSVELRRWREIRLEARTWALFRGSAENRASWEASAGLEENSAVAINCHTGRKPMIRFRCEIANAPSDDVALRVGSWITDALWHGCSIEVKGSKKPPGCEPGG